MKCTLREPALRRACMIAWLCTPALAPRTVPRQILPPGNSRGTWGGKFVVGGWGGGAGQKLPDRYLTSI